MNSKDQARQDAFVYFKEGKTQKEIGNLLGVSEKTVGQWKKRYAWPEQLAGAVLRAEAAPELPGPEPAGPEAMPGWAVSLVTLLSAQQAQLGRIETLLLRAVPAT